MMIDIKNNVLRDITQIKVLQVHLNYVFAKHLKPDKGGARQDSLGSVVHRWGAIKEKSICLVPINFVSAIAEGPLCNCRRSPMDECNTWT